MTQQGRILVFAYGTDDSGVTDDWAATETQPGVSYLADFSPASLDAVAQRVQRWKRAGDLAIFSIHWGHNWGWGVSKAHRQFAEKLIDHAGIDVVHGHSSHHVKGIEVYQGKLILYGCGDFLNDYEGIHGYEPFRGDLSLMYFPTIDISTGQLIQLIMTPTQTHHFRVEHASDEGVQWLMTTINREGIPFGTGVKKDANNRLTLHWSQSPGGYMYAKERPGFIGYAVDEPS